MKSRRRPTPHSRMKLSEIRKKIDAIDDQLIKLFNADARNLDSASVRFGDLEDRVTNAQASVFLGWPARKNLRDLSRA